MHLERLNAMLVLARERESISEGKKQRKYKESEGGRGRAEINVVNEQIYSYITMLWHDLPDSLRLYAENHGQKWMFMRKIKANFFFSLSPLHVLCQSLWIPIEALITQVSIIFQINLKYQFYLMDNQFFFPAHASWLSWVWVRMPNEFYYDSGLIICMMMVAPLSTLGFSLLNLFKGKVCMNPTI